VRVKASGVTVVEQGVRTAPLAG